MDTMKSNVDRWLAFDEGELKIVQAGLVELTDRVCFDAFNGIPAEQRDNAAGTFLAASMLSYQIDDLLNIPHPDGNVCAGVAQMIRDGSYREIAAMNAAVPEPETTDADDDDLGEAA